MARVLGILKLVLCIALYFALATVALTDPPKPTPAKPKPKPTPIIHGGGKQDPGDDDDKMSSGELSAPRPSPSPARAGVKGDASQTAKANSNAEVKPVRQPLVKTTAPTVRVKAQQKLPAKTSETVQEIKVNKTKSKKGSGDSKTDSGDAGKNKKSD